MERHQRSQTGKRDRNRKGGKSSEEEAKRGTVPPPTDERVNQDVKIHDIYTFNYLGSVMSCMVLKRLDYKCNLSPSISIPNKDYRCAYYLKGVCDGVQFNCIVLKSNNEQWNLFDIHPFCITGNEYFKKGM